MHKKFLLLLCSLSICFFDDLHLKNKEIVFLFFFFLNFRLKCYISESIKLQ